MNPHFLPFGANMAMTVPGESFPLPMVYKGCGIYFGSLEKVDVPAPLQEALTLALYDAFHKEPAPFIQEGDKESGRVTIADGNEERTFEVNLRFEKTPRDDQYIVESILEIE